ncbi:ankyrin repeat-containing domain protein [Halteromyces radiatus]|uniref:ankyrin repeat-containing domain protein n=1 Tax=Halteromyces radiatus TaxID=101107 RepID=UPI0022205285|nr:ankyrin repeat-containing domain protein [Halteromyces radiatus]KAI8084625.1 ankyrin repeat-containing domain protein [Halteromyces radiatus]
MSHLQLNNSSPRSSISITAISPPAPSHPKLEVKSKPIPPITLPLRTKQKEEDAVVITVPTISIWTAAEQGDIATLTYYIRQSPDPVAMLNKRDPKTECTLLHLAVSHAPEPYAVLDLLLTHGADPCARNVYNVQALHTIPLHCQAPRDCLALLLAHGAHVNGRDGDGWTPLHYATRFCQSSLLPVLELLIQHGADVSLVDSSRKTPLFGLLANGDHVEALAYLIQIAHSPLHLRGDFLDPITRRTHPGSIILQAAKYLRLDCLDWLLHSSTAMDQLNPILTRTELNYALRLVQQQQQKKPHVCQKIITLLETLFTTIRDDTEIGTTHKRLSILSIRRREPQHNNDNDDYSQFSDDNIDKKPKFLERMISLLTK